MFLEDPDLVYSSGYIFECLIHAQSEVVAEFYIVFPISFHMLIPSLRCYSQMASLAHQFGLCLFAFSGSELFVLVTFLVVLREFVFVLLFRLQGCFFCLKFSLVISWFVH